MSVLIINNNLERNLIIQNLYSRFNNKYIYIYNNHELSNNNLLFILDTVKYKILVLNKSEFTEELDLFNTVKQFIIDYIGPRQVDYNFFKIRGLYNNYKFKFTFNNCNNISYLFFKNTALRTKKERKYIVYTTYYIIKDVLDTTQPNTTDENKKSYIKTINV